MLLQFLETLETLAVTAALAIGLYDPETVVVGGSNVDQLPELLTALKNWRYNQATNENASSGRFSHLEAWSASRGDRGSLSAPYRISLPIP